MIPVQSVYKNRNKKVRDAYHPPTAMGKIAPGPLGWAGQTRTTTPTYADGPSPKQTQTAAAPMAGADDGKKEEGPRFNKWGPKKRAGFGALMGLFGGAAAARDFQESMLRVKEREAARTQREQEKAIADEAAARAKQVQDYRLTGDPSLAPQELQGALERKKTEGQEREEADDVYRKARDLYSVTGKPEDAPEEWRDTLEDKADKDAIASGAKAQIAKQDRFRKWWGTTKARPPEATDEEWDVFVKSLPPEERAKEKKIPVASVRRTMVAAGVNPYEIVKDDPAYRALYRTYQRTIEGLKSGENADALIDQAEQYDKLYPKAISLITAGKIFAKDEKGDEVHGADMDPEQMADFADEIVRSWMEKRSDYRGETMPGDSEEAPAPADTGRPTDPTDQEGATGLARQQGENDETWLNRLFQVALSRGSSQEEAKDWAYQVMGRE